MGGTARGYLEGTKNILNGKGSWREQITGAVGDLFTVEEKYTTAIETALGGSVNHVVTYYSSPLLRRVSIIWNLSKVVA